MVKVQGDNLICEGNIMTDNIHVMNLVEDDGQGGLRFMMCDLHAGYGWEGKQMCMYTCTCYGQVRCKEVHLRIARENIVICEFGIL